MVLVRRITHQVSQGYVTFIKNRLLRNTSTVGGHNQMWIMVAGSPLTDPDGVDGGGGGGGASLYFNPV
jgi:hypothetical protein